jgi:phage N-6-adenine-methyltransferase
MRGRKVVHSSGNDEWETPQALFDVLNEEFHFEVDRAANPANAKCPRFYTDALNIEWGGRGFLNPPYSHVGAFLEKAHHELIFRRVLTVCLVAARPDTRYWHEHVSEADEVRFLKGRLTFGGAPNAAPFPSAVVIFKPTLQGAITVSQRVVYWDWKRCLSTPGQEKSMSEQTVLV